MVVNEIGEVIADRRLSIGKEELVVTIGKPQLFEDGADYYCPYAIEGAGKKEVGYAGGVDAVQALQLALKRIGVDLAQLAAKRGMPITWFPDTPGDTGFPSQ